MTEQTAPQQTAPEHVDVLIVGAGISGIGAAWYLRRDCPDTSYAILDTEDSFGGTWWTHRFPGIRSDSDLHTFGYGFKPWVGPPIATAAEILKYMGEVIEDAGIDRHIRYRHKVLTAAWSQADALWTVEAAVLDPGGIATGETRRFTTSFLYMCQGYYRHRQGYTPEWDGMPDFRGPIVHTEEWPEDLDYTGKRVVVIGSGATAATVIPAMAGKAAHVTMLQRSPTFFRTGRNAIEIAEELRKLQVDEEWVHEITRRKILHDQDAFTRMCFETPDKMRDELIGNVRQLLGPDYDVDTHFTPSYRPWRQRIAFVPDADLFRAIADGTASVVTAEIDRFVGNGIRLKSGEVLDADIVVTATGFNMSVMGDIEFSLDGQPLDWSQTVNYRGMMFTGVPNLAWVFGYFRASWTLRAELVGEFVGRLLNHMKATGARSMAPQIPPSQQDMAILPWIDEENFNPNYLLRAMHLLPKRGEAREWQHTQDHWRERDEFPAIDLESEAFVYQWGERAEAAE